MITSTQSYNPTWLDASGFSCFQRCPTRYLFERLMGLRAHLSDDSDACGNKRNLAADFGTCIHAALPLAYASVPDAIAKFNAVWSTYPYGPGDSKRNPARAACLLSDFHAAHAGSASSQYLRMTGSGNARLAPADCTRISETEVPFSIDLGVGCSIVGRIDCPVRLSASNLPLALDYKTTQEISGRFFNNFNGSPQAIIYTMALKRLLGNEPVFGFAIEALRVSDKNCETQLHIVSVTSHECQELKDQLREAIDRRSLCDSCQRWPQNYAACAPYATFGQPGYLCEYKPLCTAPNWQDALGLYTTEPVFNPLASAV